jgi:hypothetical protein
MPKIFEYLGIVIRFFSDEHEPIHVHAFYGDTQLKVEFVISEGIVTELKYKTVKGYAPLPKDKEKDLKTLIDIYKYDMIQLWIKYFILHEKVNCTTIASKLK